MIPGSLCRRPLQSVNKPRTCFRGERRMANLLPRTSLFFSLISPPRHIALILRGGRRIRPPSNTHMGSRVASNIARNITNREEGRAPLAPADKSTCSRRHHWKKTALPRHSFHNVRWPPSCISSPFPLFPANKVLPTRALHGRPSDASLPFTCDHKYRPHSTRGSFLGTWTCELRVA